MVNLCLLPEEVLQGVDLWISVRTSASKTDRWSGGDAWQPAVLVVRGSFTTVFRQQSPNILSALFDATQDEVVSATFLELVISVNTIREASPE